MIGVFWYACEARKANKLTRQAIDTTKENFTKEERPILWVVSGGGEGAPAFEPNAKNAETGQIVWSWHFTNYGKSAANNVTYRQYIKIGDEPLTASFRKDEKKDDVSAPLPPNVAYLATVISRPGITPAYFKQLMDTDEGILIRIDMSYPSDSGQPYETHICLAHLRTGATEFCRHANYIK